MYRSGFAAILFIASTITAHAATVTEDLSFNASASIFGGASPSEFEIGPDSFSVLRLARVDYAAKASTGVVDADVRARLEATHPDTLSFGAAATTPVDLALARVPIILPDPLPNILGPFGIGSFRTRFGIEADVDVNVFGAADISLLNIDGLLRTSATSLAFTTDPFDVVVNDPFNDRIRAKDEEDVASRGNIVTVPLVGKFGARATVYATQDSRLSFGNLVGTVRATHDTGAVVTQSFALDRTDSVSLNLQRLGGWTLDLTGITVEADFSSEFGMRIGGKACVIFCGEIKSGILPIGSARIALPFSDQAMPLGTVLVTADSAIVPLPAGMPLLAAGLGLLVLLRRRRS